MPRYRCNSCGAEYSDPQPDGSAYRHACSPEEVEHGEFDRDGKQLKPERRHLRRYVRDENPHPESTEKTPRITSEGKGRVELSEVT